MTQGGSIRIDTKELDGTWVFPTDPGYPKMDGEWMVKIMDPIKMDDLGSFPLFVETPICPSEQLMYTTQGVSVKLNEVFRRSYPNRRGPTREPRTKKWWILLGLLGLHKGLGFLEHLLFPSQKINHVQGNILKMICDIKYIYMNILNVCILVKIQYIYILSSSMGTSNVLVPSKCTQKGG